MTVLIENNAGSSLASSISDSSTTVTLLTGDGSKFPSTVGGGYFYATIYEGTNIEIVKVTSRIGDVLTISRASDSTIAKAFSAGAKVEQRWNRLQIEEKIQDHALPKIVSISNGINLISVSFVTPRIDTNYAVKFSFECDDVNPIFLLGIIQNKTVNGFNILLNTPTDSANYKLNYTIGNAL